MRCLLICPIPLRKRIQKQSVAKKQWQKLHTLHGQQNPKICGIDMHWCFVQTAGIGEMYESRKMAAQSSQQSQHFSLHQCTIRYYSHYKYPAKTISCSICSHPTFSSSPPGRSTSSLDGFGSGGTCRDGGTVMLKMWHPQPLKKGWRRLPPTQL